MGLREREGPPARRRVPEKRGLRAIGVSRGGGNAEVHVASDGESTVVEIHLSPGDGHDAARGRRSMAALGAFMGAGLLMDRAYEGDPTRLLAGSFGPGRSCRPNAAARSHGSTTDRKSVV